MECACRSVTLRQDELAFLKVISSFKVSPALLKELCLTMARRKKKPAVPTGRRSTPSGNGTSAPQQLTGKRKANELASSGYSMQPANRRPALSAGSLLCPRTKHPRENKLPLAAGNPDQTGWGLRTWLYCTGPSPHLSQVGRSSPLSWIRTCPNPVSRWRHPKGACLRTCPGL